jgi:IS5 family transposase
MVTYHNLSRRPSAFVSMTGMNVADFDALYQEFAPAHAQRLAQTPTTKRDKRPRRRTVGAGRRHAHNLKDRLLMTLVWLRVYTTYEVLGFFFSLNKTNAEDNLKDVLATLQSMTTFAFERPAPERQKLRTPQAVMDAFPDVALVIDAKEQRIRRPGSTKDDTSPHDQQRPYYSGKKKAHTLKSQVGVRPDGQIDALSESAPGGANHDITLLRQSKLLDRLDAQAGEAAMTDKGYDGIGKDYPDLCIYQPHKARRGHPLTPEQKAYNRHLSRYRVVVEHTMAQLNRFAVLAQVFRHARERHSQVVRVVAGLVNRRIAVQPLKSYAVA